MVVFVVQLPSDRDSEGGVLMFYFFLRSIRVWDNETSLVTRVLSPAHSQQVTSLSPHPANDHLFLSAGMDGNVLLWDLRCPKPASCE